MNYDVQLENTLKNMRNNTGFFETHGDPEIVCMWNGYLFKMLGGTDIEINDKTIIQLLVFKKSLLVHHILL